MNTSYTMSEPPPPYPGPSGPFAIPTYETATALDCWDDSSCLPPYQSRTGQRFHPYMRILPVHRGYIPHQEKTFEEFYRSLQASVNRRATAPPAVVEASCTTAPPAPLRSPVQAPANHPVVVSSPVIEPPAPPAPAAPAPHPPAQGPAQDPEEHRRRLIRRLFLLPEIVRIVRAGLGVALRAAEARYLGMTSIAN